MYHEKYKWFCLIDPHNIASEFVQSLHQYGGGSKRTIHTIFFSDEKNGNSSSKLFLIEAIKEGMYVMIDAKRSIVIPSELMPLIDFQRNKNDVFQIISYLKVYISFKIIF